MTYTIEQIEQALLECSTENEIGPFVYTQDFLEILIDNG
jgi:hypothetical protein